jgi:hypothetical protein
LRCYREQAFTAAAGFVVPARRKTSGENEFFSNLCQPAPQLKTPEEPPERAAAAKIGGPTWCAPQLIRGMGLTVLCDRMAFMHELLGRLPVEGRVLDLGCGNGSFDASGLQATVIGLDLEGGSTPPARFVRGDASGLPFAAGTFDAVVSNHSLEHVRDLDGCLSEMSRVLKSDGCVYVAVPDSTTLTDRLYRWLADGGGHVNPFTSAAELSRKIETATALPHCGTRTLCTSFSFLNRKLHRTPRRLLLLGGGTQTSLLLGTYFLRLMDRFFGTRLIVYGWALYFGEGTESIERATWTNVCILCGAGHGSSWLLDEKRVFRRLLPFYRCPQCGTLNLFTRDEHYSHLNAPVSQALEAPPPVVAAR